MTLSPAMQTAAAQPVAAWFAAVEIVLPSHTIRVLDGAGVVSFGGRTFTGADSVYGALQSIDPFADGVGDQAPSITIKLLPPTETAAVGLADPAVQGGAVSVWVGIVELATGLAVADPDLRFTGEIDVPTLRVGRGSRTLEYTCVSAWERFFADDEGSRLNDAYHQSIWPGELGLEYVTSVTHQLPWGADVPRPVIASYSSTSSTGGFGGAGGGFRGAGFRLSL